MARWGEMGRCAAALAPGQALRLHLPPEAFMRLGPAVEEAGR